MKKRNLLIILLVFGFTILNSFLYSEKTLANETEPIKHEGMHVVNQVLK